MRSSRKNWMFHNTANGADASALVYSISETAPLVKAAITLRRGAWFDVY
jgi:hypothetical protein